MKTAPKTTNEEPKEEFLGKTGTGWDKRLAALVAAHCANYQYPREHRIVWGKELPKMGYPYFQGVAWGADLLWCVRWGTQAEIKSALEMAHHYFRQELYDVGLWRVDQLACNPYGGFHLEGMMLMRLAAHELQSGDLLSLSDIQFSGLGAVCATNSTPSGEVWVAGARGRYGRASLLHHKDRPPLNSNLNAWWRLVNKLPQLGALARSARWSEPFWTPAYLARMLVEMFEDNFALDQRATYEFMPLLLTPMAFERGEDDRGPWFSSRFLEPPQHMPDKCCSWLVCHEDETFGQVGGGVEYDIGFKVPYTSPKGVDESFLTGTPASAAR